MALAETGARFYLETALKDDGVYEINFEYADQPVSATFDQKGELQTAIINGSKLEGQEAKDEYNRLFTWMERTEMAERHTREYDILAENARKDAAARKMRESNANIWRRRQEREERMERDANDPLPLTSLDLENEEYLRKLLGHTPEKTPLEKALEIHRRYLELRDDGNQW